MALTSSVDERNEIVLVEGFFAAVQKILIPSWRFVTIIFAEDVLYANQIDLKSSENFLRIELDLNYVCRSARTDHN